LSGCVSGKIIQAREEFYNGHIAQASEAVSDPEGISDRNLLLYYLEKGLILHHAGAYQESSDAFLSASGLIKEQEVISATRQTGSLVTTEWLTEFKGEYAERLLVHTYLMMNFLITGNHESALVEAKQALEIYETYPDACNGDFFTRALIAHCYEALGDINDAYIEYKKLAELMGDPVPVADKLCEIASVLGFDDEVALYCPYLSEAGSTSADNTKEAELILFVSQGKSPVKVPENIVVPPSIRFSFSTYKNRSRSFYPPEVRINSDSNPVNMITTDVAGVLKSSLNERLAAIIVKETARVAAKEAIAHNLDDPLVEALVRIAFLVMEEPDTRSWETLPGYLTMIRVPIASGSQQVTIVNSSENTSRPALALEFESTGKRYYYSVVRDGEVKLDLQNSE